MQATWTHNRTLRSSPNHLWSFLFLLIIFSSLQSPLWIKQEINTATTLSGSLSPVYIKMKSKNVRFIITVALLLLWDRCGKYKKISISFDTLLRPFLLIYYFLQAQYDFNFILLKQRNYYCLCYSKNDRKASFCAASVEQNALQELRNWNTL